MQIKMTNSINKKNKPCQSDAAVVKYVAFQQLHSTLNRDTVNFTGLNRTLSKMAYASSKSIKKEMTNFPQSKGIVGNLPAEWIQKIPKENRENVIKELYGELKKIVNEFKADRFCDYDTSENLNKAFVKAGIIKNGDKVELDFLEEGHYGYAYRLKGLSDNKYMIKVFKPKDRLSDLHGSLIEPNRAAFWQKYAGKNTQMVPFYFADLEAEYMVNKFLDKNVAKPKKNIPPEVYGLTSSDIDKTADTGHNKINGYQIEYGGIFIGESTMLRNKEKQAAFRKFLAAPKEKQLATINKADEIVKMHIIDTIDLRPIKDRAAYFEKLLQEPNDKIKAKLADELLKLPTADAISLFEKLATGGSDRVKVQLTKHVQNLPVANRVDCFKLLQKDSSDAVKKNLVYIVNYIPKEQKEECYKLLEESSGPEVKNKINEFRECIPQRDFSEHANTLKMPIETPKDSGLITDILGKLKKD